VRSDLACSFAGCGRRVARRDLCGTHAHQFYAGKPLVPIKTAQVPSPDLFWSRVKKGDGCWEWSGPRFKRYGRFLRNVPAHRYSWEITNGPIPDGMYVCHRCDNPPCVRPDHLFVGASSDNAMDRERKGRSRNRSGTHCNFSRLTEADVAAIRLSDGKYADLAARFSVSTATVSRIRRGLIWKHVQVPSQVAP